MVKIDGNVVFAEGAELSDDELRQAKHIAEMTPVVVARGPDGEMQISPVTMEKQWLERQRRRHRPVEMIENMGERPIFAHVTARRFAATLEHIDRECPSCYVTPMVRNDGIQWLPILVIWNILGKVEGYCDFNTGLLYLE